MVPYAFPQDVRIWRDFGLTLPFQTRLTQTKPVLPLSNEHGSQVKDQGQWQCCQISIKNFPIGLQVMYPYFPDTPRINTWMCHVICRDTFELICKYMHFIKMVSLPTYQGPPTPFNIYPAICHLNRKFQTLYLQNQKTAIDEGLTLWKECLSGSTYHHRLQSLE
jgi:hypothetical protein